MKKIGYVKYYCQDCKESFNVKDFISKELIRFDKRAFCHRCGKNKTNKFGENIIRKRKIITSLDSPASESQLNYIKGLGGDPGSVKTKREAGEIIFKLKKEQGLIK